MVLHHETPPLTPTTADQVDYDSLYSEFWRFYISKTSLKMRKVTYSSVTSSQCKVCGPSRGSRAESAGETLLHVAPSGIYILYRNLMFKAEWCLPASAEGESLAEKLSCVQYRLQFDQYPKKNFLIHASHVDLARTAVWLRWK